MKLALFAWADQKEIKQRLWRTLSYSTCRIYPPNTKFATSHFRSVFKCICHIFLPLDVIIFTSTPLLIVISQSRDINAEHHSYRSSETSFKMSVYNCLFVECLLFRFRHTRLNSNVSLKNILFYRSIDA